MLRIETFAPARRCTAPSTCSLRRGTTRHDLEHQRPEMRRTDLGLAGHFGQYAAHGVDRVVAEPAAELALVGLVELPRGL